MEGQAGAADDDRFLILPHPAAFFGELRERNRRRILLDPAPEILNSWTVHHSVTERPRWTAATNSSDRGYRRRSTSPDSRWSWRPHTNATAPASSLCSSFRRPM